MSCTRTTSSRRILIVLLVALLETIALMAAGAFSGAGPAFVRVAPGGGCPGCLHLPSSERFA